MPEFPIPGAVPVVAGEAGARRAGLGCGGNPAGRLSP